MLIIHNYTNLHLLLRIILHDIVIYVSIYLIVILNVIIAQVQKITFSNLITCTLGKQFFKSAQYSSCFNTCPQIGGHKSCWATMSHK